MPENIVNLEKETKKLFIKLHQEVFGKGPEEVWVKINRNVVTFFCGGVFTPLEEFLLSSGDEKEITRLRKKIYTYIEQRVHIEIENICGVEVLGSSREICITTKCFYGVILMKNNLQESSKTPKNH